MSTNLPSYQFMISIHALREEGDQLSQVYLSHLRSNFYPRPPRGGRPRPLTAVTTTYDFYPRPPRGGRLHHGQGQELGKQFLSTPSARRATRAAPKTAKEQAAFLSTPSARRATRKRHSPIEWDNVFLSTPSARRATRAHCSINDAAPNFYPRPPRGGRPLSMVANAVAS